MKRTRSGRSRGTGAMEGGKGQEIWRKEGRKRKRGSKWRSWKIWGVQVGVGVRVEAAIGREWKKD